MARRAHRLAIALVVLGVAALPACRDQHASPDPVPPPPAKQCFSTTVHPGAPAEALFERRDLQGGGPTWAGVFEVVVRDRGSVGAEIQKPGAGPGFGRVYAIQHRGKSTWFALDDEGDAATFCAGSAELLAEMRAEYERLRREPAALEKVLDRVDPADLE